MRAARNRPGRLWGRLRGDGRIPVGEALHPIALASVIVLLVNDWWLKPSAAPAWLTGKLSDVAGLVFAPLVLTALLDLVLWGAARGGAKVDWRLGPRRLAAALVATGGVFVAVKASPATAAAVATAWSWLGIDARIYPDPWDLLALPALAVAAWIGRAEIALNPRAAAAATSSPAPRSARADRP